MGNGSRLGPPLVSLVTAAADAGGLYMVWVWALWMTGVLLGSSAVAVEAEQVDAFVVEELGYSAAPGVAYAIIDGGESVARSAGTTTRGGRQEVSPHTRFPLGSVSKSFTALAVMQLVEAGEVRLDDPVSATLPAFAEGPAKEVTILQLLNHTSGYSTAQGNRLHALEPSTPTQLSTYAATLARLPPARAPGSVWAYSNTNYQILGAVIEEVSGLRYPDYVRRRILEPLGMTETTVGGEASTADTVTGHRPWFGGVRAYEAPRSEPVHDPAGGLTSSAHDMALYMAMWLNGRDDVLSAEGKARMMQPSSPISPWYGLGWAIDAESGSVYHSGLVPGAEALAMLDPARGRSVVVMVNANGGFGFSDTTRLLNGVVAHALEHPEESGSLVGPKVAFLSVAVPAPLFVLSAFVSWRGRSALRAKRESGAGRFSLWFPLVITVGLAWFLLQVLPGFFGGSFATIQLFQPDFALCLVATAAAGLAWAVLRLGLAYGQRGGSEPVA